MENESNTRGRGSRGRMSTSRFVRGRSVRGGNTSWRPYFYIRRGRGSRQTRGGLTGDGSTTLSETVSSSPPIVVSNNYKQMNTIPIDQNPPQYPGWRLYFPHENFNQNSDLCNHIKLIENYFLTNIEDYNLLNISKERWFLLNIANLLKDQQLLNQWADFDKFLVENPENVWACAGVAMHKLVTIAVIENSVKTNDNKRYYTPPFKSVDIIFVRFIKYHPILSLGLINSSHYGRLISVRGNVLRNCSVEILCKWMAFTCPLCGYNQAIRQTNKSVSVPFSCQSECRGKKFFKAVRSSPHTRLESFQKIVLHENNPIQINRSHTPVSIEVDLTNELVDSVCPGDNVIITGILKYRSHDDCLKKDLEASKMYIKALGITDSKKICVQNSLEFDEKELEAIKLISQGNTFKLLVQSLCPEIYGREIVKAGILLGLFGGTSSTHKKGKIDVLLVGDPGLGKTQLLRSAALKSPVATYIYGIESGETARLNVKIRNEKGKMTIGESLEGGALVMADNGVCVIDNIEKTTASHQMMIGMMDQRIVTIYNSKIICNLYARAGLIAASSPNGGHYDKSKTLNENVRLNPALLSSFDLIFILVDKPSMYHDLRYAKHALNLEKKKIPTKFIDFKPKGQDSETQDLYKSLDLESRLALLSEENIDLIPEVLMKKYIAFSKKTINPLLNADASKILKTFFVEMRQQISERNSNTVTIRNLESLIRLTQARARLELSAEATAEHAEDVVSILRYSLTDRNTIDSESGGPSRLNGKPLSQASQVRAFLKIIKSQCILLNQRVFEFDELKDMAVNGGITGSITPLIEVINLQGFLLKKGHNKYEYLMET